MRTVGLRLAAAVFSGVMYWLAFPGQDLWPLAFVAFVPLLLVAPGTSSAWAIAMGFVMGATAIGLGFSWMPSTVGRFMDCSWSCAHALFFAFTAYHAGQFALLSWLTTRCMANGMVLWFSFPLGFVASECLYPTVFPWYFGAALHEVIPLMQVAEWGGPIAVGLVPAVANVALSDLARAAYERRRPPIRTLVIVLLLLTGVWTFGVVRVAMVDATTASATAVPIGIVQARDKSIRREPRESLEQLRQLTIAVRDRGARLIFWSETALPFALAEETRNELLRDSVSTGLDVALVLGAPVSRSDGIRWNGVFALDERGAVTGRYDKRKLLAFGETLPFASLFPSLARLFPHTLATTAGTRSAALPIQVSGEVFVVWTSVCYEDVHPAFFNQGISQADPDLLVALADDSWFADVTEMQQHLALARFRSIEHRRFFVRATSNGISAVVDPVGRIVAASQPFRREALLAQVRWRKGWTVYEILGDALWWLVSALAVVKASRLDRLVEKVRASRWRGRRG